jgi:DNA-binding response OmpR family regulator
MGKRILLVDDDPWVLRMVQTVLQRRGHLIETAGEGKEGLQKALEFKPDLIISDVMMPRMNGWTFVRALRSYKEMSLVPVIFLTGLSSEEDRILGFRLGADDYLSKPFRFEELDLRVEKCLRQSELIRSRAASQIEEESRAGLSGDLAQMGLSSLLTFLELERKSGILVLQGRAAGRVFLRGGQPVHAIIDGPRKRHGADAIFDMLLWSSGTFAFSMVEVDMEDQIGLTTTHLLLEGARRIDEAASAG